MATEENKKETAFEKPQKYVLKKNFRTEKKEYKAGEGYSHKDENVIAYLKQNKYI